MNTLMTEQNPYYQVIRKQFRNLHADKLHVGTLTSIIMYWHCVW